MACDQREKCPLFNGRLALMPGLVDLYKQQFCENDCESCARLRVRRALGPGTVPENLYPPQKHKALELIEQARKAG